MEHPGSRDIRRSRIQAIALYATNDLPSREHPLMAESRKEGLNMNRNLLLSLGIFLMLFSPADAQTELPPIQIFLNHPVHFINPGGEDMVVNTGTYQIEQAEEWMRLIPGERTDAILLQAQSITHSDPLESAQPLSEKTT